MNRITNWALTFEQQVEQRMWPQEVYGSFYLDVAALADDAVSSNDRPHAIAAIFLYQQLAEEMLCIVDYWCYFEQALALYPTELVYVEPERLMFGQLIDRIQHRQKFPYKDSFLKAVSRLNSECRIPVAHKLLKTDILSQAIELARAAQAFFSEAVRDYADISEYFFSRYNKIADRIEIKRQN